MGSKLTLAERGKRLGISRQRVHQILYDTDYDTCPQCGERKRKSSTLCRKCYFLAHRSTVVCAECGRSFVMTKSDADSATRHFCKDCWGTLTQKHVRYQPRQGQCPVCGHTAWIGDFRQNRNGGKA